jgi:hypothetical protein
MVDIIVIFNKLVGLLTLYDKPKVNEMYYGKSAYHSTTIQVHLVLSLLIQTYFPPLWPSMYYNYYKNYFLQNIYLSIYYLRS